MGLNLEILKGTLGAGAQVVKDWRETNTKRREDANRHVETIYKDANRHVETIHKDANHHAETMYELKSKRILGYLDAGISAVSAISSAWATVCSARESRNRLRLETEEGERTHQKAMLEIERTHQEAMEKLSIERTRIARELGNAETESARLHEHLRRITDSLTGEYDFYLSMNDQDFLSDTVTQRLNELRKAIWGLTHELLSTESPLSK